MPYRQTPSSSHTETMPPGIADLATLVGLICTWKQERGSIHGDKFDDYMVWLANHNFQELRDRIFDSEELQRELAQLLRTDVGELSAKLDTIMQAISAVSQKIDGFSQISERLSAATDLLSQQACRVLKTFAAFDTAERLIVAHHQTLDGSSWELHLSPGVGVFFPDQTRFVANDIDLLVHLNLLQHIQNTGEGFPMLVLTRSGMAFAEGLEIAPYDID